MVDTLNSCLDYLVHLLPAPLCSVYVILRTYMHFSCIECYSGTVTKSKSSKYYLTFQDKMDVIPCENNKRLQLAYYSALCVNFFFNEQLITQGTVFIGPNGSSSLKSPRYYYITILVIFV